MCGEMLILLDPMHHHGAVDMVAMRVPRWTHARVTCSLGKSFSVARPPPLVRRTHSKPYYVTTPIFYVNAEPHIGHLHSGVLADVLARYAQLRTHGWSCMRGYKPASKPTSSLMLTGTDEHGMKIQRVAESLGEEPRALCDRVSARFLVCSLRAIHSRTLRARATCASCGSSARPMRITQKPCSTFGYVE